MSEEAKRIKDYYIRPPLSLIDTDWQKRKGGAQFEVQTTIWCDRHQPQYRVVIPERLRLDDISPSMTDIEMRYITYVPTGRVVYDNTRIPAEAVVYEYILETLLGKKDLRMR